MGDVAISEEGAVPGSLPGLFGGDPATVGDLALEAFESFDEHAQLLGTRIGRVPAGDGRRLQAMAGLDEERVDALAGVGIEAVGSGLFAAGDERGSG